MKRKTSLPILGLALILGTLLIVPFGAVGAQGPEPQGGAGTLAALGTPALSAVEGAFTYQGRLNDGGDLANGTYDFEFKLYSAASGGSQVGSTVTKDDVTVTDGLFTVELDFGSGVFTGDARWLEIGVRPGSSTGAYTTLTPRQALTPAPYALALPGLWTQPNATSPNVIGGYSGNSVTGGVVGATIGGGGLSGKTNQVTADYATVGGGRGNEAGGYAATIGGGRTNVASGDYAAIGGGRTNEVSGLAAIVPGGYRNTAQGNYSFAAGRRAKADHDGAFVWADSTDADFASTAEDQFLVRATGGATFNVGTAALHTEGDVAITGDLTLAGTLNNGNPWTSANDGSGSGLDADMVDGIHASNMRQRRFWGTVTNCSTFVFAQYPNDRPFQLLLFMDGQASSAWCQVMGSKVHCSANESIHPEVRYRSCPISNGVCRILELDGANVRWQIQNATDIWARCVVGSPDYHAEIWY